MAKAEEEEKQKGPEPCGVRASGEESLGGALYAQPPPGGM